MGKRGYKKRSWRWCGSRRNQSIAYTWESAKFSVKERNIWSGKTWIDILRYVPYFAPKSILTRYPIKSGWLLDDLSSWSFIRTPYTYFLIFSISFLSFSKHLIFILWPFVTFLRLCKFLPKCSNKFLIKMKCFIPWFL